MGNLKQLREQCIVAAYETTGEVAIRLGKVFNVSARTITNVLGRYGIIVKMGRPRKLRKEKADGRD